MTKTKYGSVQRFPEPFVTKWKDLLLDRGYYKLYEPILLPTNSVASQLKAVKKVGSVLEGEQDSAMLIRLLVEVHSSCVSRHPLQRAISSMLLSFSNEDLKLATVKSISTNLFDMLCGDHGYETEDGTTISGRMQYLDSLLENFALGEMGLKLQFLLVLDYCTKMIQHCSRLQLDVLVDVLKVTINVIQPFSIGFFSVVVESSSWPIQKPSMSPSDKIQHMKEILSEINKICEELLLRGDLQHDLTLSAAMLAIAVSNILNSTSEEPFLHYAKRVSLFFSLEHLSSFSRLAVCHALLAKTDSSMMTGVMVDGEPLLLSLFPKVCHLFDGFTETSDRYIASRTLSLWSSVARACACTEDVLVTHALTPSGPMMRRLLQYVWSLWEDPVDGIRVQCKEMFENSIKIYQQLDSDANESLFGLAKQLVSLESPSRGKFILLSSLARHLSIGKLIHAFPELPRDILSVMGHQSLACHAGDLWSKLVNLHWLEVKGGKENEASWNDIWVLDVLGTMCNSDPPARRHITQHCLPSLFHSNTTCMKYVNEHLEEIGSSSLKDTVMATRLACLRCAKAEGNGSNEDLEALEVIFHSSMHHSEEEISMSCLCMVCETHKTTDPPVPSHLTLLLDFIEVNGNTTSSEFKECLLNCLKKILNRIKDSVYALVKRHQKRHGPDPSPLIQSYKKFLRDLLNQQFRQIHPLTSFQRRNISLSMLRLLASCFSLPCEETARVAIAPLCEGGGVAPSFLPFFVFPHEVSQSQATSLLDGLQDQYDTNRVICLQLLMMLPIEALGFKKTSFTRQCTATYLEWVGQPKSTSCAMAAYVLKFLITASCEDFNSHLAQLLNEREGSSVGGSSQPPTLRTLDLLFILLYKHIVVAKDNLVMSSMTAPMYGVLQSIRAIFEQKLADTKFRESLFNNDNDDCDGGGSSAISRLIKVCQELSKIVSPVVCSSSPEGFLPDIGNLSMVDVPSSSSSSSDTPGSSSGNAQSLLLCCWHTMKEVSLLLGYLVEQLHGPDKPCPLKGDQMWAISSIYIHQLTEARHRGAFEMAYTGFSKLCRALWLSPDPEMSQKPTLWVKELLDSLQSSSIAKLLTVTRRSAGLPFYMQAILSSEPSLRGRPCLKSAMEVLLKIARNSVTNSATNPATSTNSATNPAEPGGGVTGPQPGGGVTGPQPAALHALNILKALYKDSRLGEHIVSYIPEGLMIAMAGFAANLWPVRNSSSLLFASLVLRIFGAKRVQDEHSIENKITAREFFTRFPGLYSYLLRELQESTKKLIADMSTGSLQPSLLPLLLILSRLYPSPLDDANSPISLKPFIPLLIICTCCSVWKTRLLVARTLPLMMTQHNWWNVVSELYSRMSFSDQNGLHGLLLVVERLVEDRQNLMAMVVRNPSSSEDGKTVATLILECHLQKMWVGLSDNECPITRSLYLKVLHDLLEYQCSSVLSESISLQVSNFISQSLKACADLRASAQEDKVFHELVLLENVRLLQLTSSRSLSLLFSSSCPTAESTCRALMNALRCSGSAVVRVYALRCVSLMMEEACCYDDVMEMVVDILTLESEPEVLVEAYSSIISKSGMAQKIHRIEILVSRAYHMHLQSCNRIELRVSLISFLSSFLAHLDNPLQYLGGLLESFVNLSVPTQALEIRLAISTSVLRLWPVALGDGGGGDDSGDALKETLLCCKVVVALLQDTGGDVRVSMASVVADILRGKGSLLPDTLDSLNPPSALKYFLISLPCLIPDASTSFEVLVGLLPENKSEAPDAPSNPLFDEDPVNDYIEELVLIKYLVKGLEIVIHKLIATHNSGPKHFDSLIKHARQKECDLSVWKDPRGHLDQIKARFLSPLVEKTQQFRRKQ